MSLAYYVGITKLDRLETLLDVSDDIQYCSRNERIWGYKEDIHDNCINPTCLESLTPVEVRIKAEILDIDRSHSTVK